MTFRVTYTPRSTIKGKGHAELVSASRELTINATMKYGFVYFMSNKNHTTLYIGVTNNIEVRVKQHKSSCGSIFTSNYNLTDLMYFEKILGFGKAIDREKQYKNWHKEWKWNLIKKENPELKDLTTDWFTDDELKEYLEKFKSEKLARDSETSSE